MSSLSLEEEDCAVAEVEVDEVFGLMGNKGSEIPANNAVPSWAFSLIELEYIRLYVA
jgi:hypothetical protein